MTARERELLDFITTRIRDHRISPSFSEMMAATGIRSKSDISRLVHQLADKGHIIVKPYRARAIELPPSAEAIEQARQEGYDAGYRAAIKEFGHRVVERHAIASRVEDAEDIHT